ncbi:MAG: BolA/IbaG family iron-sulfur metabolism protein [Candidatus Thiodiazotropha sp. (ex. Lucinisca nassula)]|uniref:BolA/IbaG family iron-sulfur metabolism protein n=1 Tax=Candidatus Thiodiazotropha sp. LNASS1 TaxID=3096260 RepID=UPI000D339841|nr:BolA/IbaG family iron-sulfur metabolism protein [Candidatus Thiodiazotropha sp. (ex. Lucinisca nassula)]MBW9274245.1 BolA/IbaG family iron-sulfur metabolism protein [Candidatus Thiodiazotropha sp. (ex. Lucinisca nassula)]PUB79965.1 MAG: BolA family transcriptional regulator [gamma proteobacterium symbiont of Ctena orbiculata]PUB87851.1 MAG: BolA family transcriptional regulator [gamma proteobacterium symbiont of Ctena orbiculata]
MTTIQETIQTKLASAFAPLHLEVVNESHMHNVPEGSESHFKVVLVSEAFKGEKLINRHRQVNKVLTEELQGGVHALALHTLTPEDWFDQGGKVADSPPCLGGSNRG